LLQIVNLTPGEQEWLSNHLGHEVHIDKDYYRANDAVLEIAKISRLLMVADSGHMAQYAGKSLTDIGVEGIPVTVEFLYVFFICIMLSYMLKQIITVLLFNLVLLILACSKMFFYYLL
jgi:hypothetical protein